MSNTLQPKDLEIVNKFRGFVTEELVARNRNPVASTGTMVVYSDGSASLNIESDMTAPLNIVFDELPPKQLLSIDDMLVAWAKDYNHIPDNIQRNGVVVKVNLGEPEDGCEIYVITDTIEQIREKYKNTSHKSIDSFICDYMYTTYVEFK